MNISFKNFKYDTVDILARVYENQSTLDIENELFCGEVLIRKGLEINGGRWVAGFPRGIAEAISQSLKSIPKIEKYKVQISNELPQTVGHLNYCDDAFDNSIRMLLKRTK